MAARIVLQTLSVSWTKASRGAPGATMRNSVPEALPLPAEVLDSTASWRHEKSFHESADFVPQTDHLYRLPDDFERAAGLRVEHAGERLRCYFVWSPGIGAPDRSERGSAMDRFAFNLETGETGRLKFHGRVSFDHGWEYSQVIQNIGWVESCDSDLFDALDHEFLSLPPLR